MAKISTAVLAVVSVAAVPAAWASVLDILPRQTPDPAAAVVAYSPPEPAPTSAPKPRWASIDEQNLFGRQNDDQRLCGYLSNGASLTCVATDYTCTNSGSFRGCCSGATCRSATAFRTTCYSRDHSICVSVSFGPNTLCCSASTAPICVTYGYTTSASPGLTFTNFACTTANAAGSFRLSADPPSTASSSRPSTSSSSPSSSRTGASSTGGSSADPSGTSTSSSSSPTSSAPAASGGSNTPVGAIVGGVVGGVALLAIIAFAVWFIMRRSRKEKAAAHEQQAMMGGGGMPMTGPQQQQSQYTGSTYNMPPGAMGAGGVHDPNKAYYAGQTSPGMVHNAQQPNMAGFGNHTTPSPQHTGGYISPQNSGGAPPAGYTPTQYSAQPGQPGQPHHQQQAPPAELGSTTAYGAGSRPSELM